MKPISLAMMMTLGTAMLSAQTPQPSANTGYTASVRSRWNAIKRNIAGSAQAMPEAGFAFRPTPDVRTFGELLGHLAN
jgi:hypothetical protein